MIRKYCIGVCVILALIVLRVAFAYWPLLRGETCYGFERQRDAQTLRMLWKPYVTAAAEKTRQSKPAIASVVSSAELALAIREYFDDLANCVEVRGREHCLFTTMNPNPSSYDDIFTKYDIPRKDTSAYVWSTPAGKKTLEGGGQFLLDNGDIGLVVKIGDSTIGVRGRYDFPWQSCDNKYLRDMNYIDVYCIRGACS